MKRAWICVALLLAFLTGCGSSTSETPAPTEAAAAEDELRVVTLGGMPHEYRNLIDGFHASQDSWRIVLEDCSDEEEQDRLRVELLTGGGPDGYLAGSRGFLQNLEQGGALMDLRPSMERLGLAPEDFVAALRNDILEAEAVHTLICSYELWGFTAPAALVGDKDHLTMEEAQTIARKEDLYLFNPEFFQDWLLEWVMVFSLGSYVDLDGGICTLDSPDFAALLEACKALRPEIDTSILGSYDNCLLYQLPLQNFRLYDSLCEQGRRIVGFPTDEGNGCTLYPLLQVAVGATTDRLEGMEAFLDYCFSPEGQRALILGTGFPALQSELAAAVDDAVAGDTLLMLGDSLTREDGDALLELVEATEGTRFFDHTIESIIKEEAAAFFAGDKTAQETADLIQSRVSLYLGEQR